MAKTGFFRATAEAIDRLAMFYDWFSPALIGLYRLKSEVAREISNGNKALWGQAPDSLDRLVISMSIQTKG